MIRILPSPVEEAIPFSGECGMCGAPDSRHRTLDTIKERFMAGELVTDLVDDYDLSSDVILYIVRHYDIRTGTWSIVAEPSDKEPCASLIPYFGSMIPGAVLILNRGSSRPVMCGPVAMWGCLTMHRLP